MATKRTSPAPPLSTDHPRPSKMKSRPSGLGKVCIICLGAPKLQPVRDYPYDGMWDHSLFLLDLDAAEWDRGDSSSSYIPVNPNMCFSSTKLGVDGCGVLDSTLYLFGENKRDVFSFDLSSIPSSVPSLSDPPLELTEKMLGGATHFMNFPKRYPLACQTPDRENMIVFSSMLSVVNRDDDEQIGDFELFDGKRWIPLPDIRPILRHYCSSFDDDIVLRSYSFIDNGPVLQIATEVGDFTLDIQKLSNRHWVPSNSDWVRLEKYLHHPGRGVSMLIRGRLHVMDWLEWVEEGNKRHELQLYTGLPSKAESERRSGCGITWLSSPPLTNRFCVVRSHANRRTAQTYLVIDACDFDDEVPHPKVKKRIKFAVGPKNVDLNPFFTPITLCSIP